MFAYRNYVMELVGTFIFVATIGLAVLSGSSFAPFAIGLVLAILVYAGSHVSGSHYNPAVTLAVALRGKLSRPDALGYWVSQFVGAALGALVVIAITGTQFYVAPGVDVSIWSAVIVEVLFTFLLAFVVLQTATTLEQDGNSYYGLAIGLTVTVGAIVAGTISGGAFNPAVGLSPLFVAGSTGYRWLYLVAPMVGGALAAGFFALIHDWELENIDADMFEYEEELVEFVVDDEVE